jgi:hypothetical protein
MAGIIYRRWTVLGARDHPVYRARRDTELPSGWIPRPEQLRNSDSPCWEAGSLSADSAALVVWWLAWWPLVPKIAGSNPAEAVGFFGRKKILSMPSFGGEVKPSVPCRGFAACKRSLLFTWKSESQAKLTCHFLTQFRPSLTEASHVALRGAPLEMTGGTKRGAQRAHTLKA